MHRLQELVRLHRMGTGARKVARLLGMSPNTERLYREALEKEQLLDGSPEDLPSLSDLQAILARHRPRRPVPPQELSSIEEWQSQIEALMSKGLTPRPIFDRLRLEESSFSGSYWAVKRLCRRLSVQQGVRAEDVAIPVETDPGEIAQVDFGYVGKLICPQNHVPRKAWVFVMTLGHSRHMFAEVVFDQKTSTWIDLHIRAFVFFGGVPQVIVPDNLKAAVIRASFAVDDDSELNRSYRELARYYGFTIDPAPPRAPKKKGKVESSVKYVKRNALAGRENEDLNDVNTALMRWVLEVAGTRLHGSTGRPPLELFSEFEQAELQKLPAKPYEIVIWKRATVHQDAHVTFDGRLYSVHWTWIGQKVWVRATPSSVVISKLSEGPESSGEDRPAMHSRRGPDRKSTHDAHLPEGRRDRRHRSHTYWQERAEQIGPETGCLVREIFGLDDVLSQLRKVQSIVTFLEGFPKERAEGASQRACFYGTFSYRGVRSILSQALDLEPLPQPTLPTPPGAPPRYARSIRELVEARWEAGYEPH